MPLANAPDHASWSMFVAAHRAQQPRRHRRGDADQILAFTPDPGTRLWIEHETFGERASVEFVTTLADVLTRLTLVRPPWPQFLIVDVYAISAAEIALLDAIRNAGWLGTVIAIGDPANPLLRSRGIDVTLPRTLRCELLRNAIKQLKQLASDRSTARMRRIAL